MDARLTAVEEAAVRHEEWHRDIGSRMLSFEAKLDANTIVTEEIKDLLTSFKGAMKVLEMMGKVAKPIMYLSAAVGALIALWPKK